MAIIQVRFQRDDFQRVFFYISQVDLDLFSLRIEYCEQKGLECLTYNPSFELEMHQPIEEYNGKYSATCKQVIDECIRANLK